MIRRKIWISGPKKQVKKTDQIFQERAFGLRRPQNFAVSLVFFLFLKKWKRTFRLRRHHNFADRHGRRIDRCVSKTDVSLETFSRFRFQMRPKMKDILIFCCAEQAFRLRRPHNFAFSPEFFPMRKQKSTSENSPFALCDVKTQTPRKERAPARSACVSRFNTF